MFTGSLVALVTPFNDAGEIDFSTLSTLIDWHVLEGTSALVVAGTTGESATLSDDEKVQLAKFAVEYSAGRIAIIAGNGTNSTHTSVALTKALNNTGIKGFLTVTPYYNKPTDAGLLAHYQAISEASELPIILYNVPGRTCCDLSVSLVAKLAELKHIIGIKDATAELSRIQSYRRLCPEDFVLLSGDDETGLAFCQQGGDGVISVTANVVPKAMAQIQQLVKEQKYEQAQAIDSQLAQLHKNLFVESNPIPVKWALFYNKRLPNANMRLPLVPLSANGQVLLGKTLDDLTQELQEF